jgi:DNA-binding CsgD family transcriptional regulator
MLSKRIRLAIILGLTWFPLFFCWNLFSDDMYIGAYRALFYSAFVGTIFLLHLLRYRLRSFINHLLTLCASCVLLATLIVLPILIGDEPIGTNGLMLWYPARGAATGLLFFSSLTQMMLDIKTEGSYLLLQALFIAALGALVLFITQSINPVFACVALALCPLLLSVCSFWGQGRPPHQEEPESPPSVSKSRGSSLEESSAPSSNRDSRQLQVTRQRRDIFHYKNNIIAAMIISGIVQGVVIQELFVLKPSLEVSILVASVVILIVFLVGLRLRFGTSQLNSFVAVRMLNPYLLGLIMALPYAVNHLYIPAIFAIVAIWTLNFIFRIKISAEVSNTLSIDSIDAYGSNFLLHALGLCIGMLFSSTFRLMDGPIHPYALVVIACLFATSMSFLLVDEKSLPSWQLVNRDSESVLVESCKFTAKKYGLTEREQEVLFLLAKGRNALHVAEELCISVQTAKTHMKRVYAKLNVHSQQKLLDAIDAASFRRNKDIS